MVLGGLIHSTPKKRCRRYRNVMTVIYLKMTNKQGAKTMKPYKTITFGMAEFAYARHLRDELGHTGEIIYPNKDASKQDRDGVWLLLTITGERLGTVSPDGTVRTT